MGRDLMRSPHPLTAVWADYAPDFPKQYYRENIFIVIYNLSLWVSKGTEW